MLVGEHVARGDLVMARGRLRQSSWDKDFADPLGVDLICLDFARVAPQAAGKRANTG